MTAMESSRGTRHASRATTIKQDATASKGMVTSNHPLASLAGTEMLVMGGNAIDAAIATMFALSVVEPMMTSIFGAGFINIRLADGTCTTIDNYATVPGAASEDMFEPIPDNLENDVVGSLNKTGYLAVATPAPCWAGRRPSSSTGSCRCTMCCSLRSASRDTGSASAPT